MKIPFHRAAWSGEELQNLTSALEGSDGSGDGIFTDRVKRRLQQVYKTEKILMTASGTMALEMALQLTKLAPGDEVIMPSFNFPSAANAVLLAGGRPVFVETGRDLMLDPVSAARAVTEKTKGILVVHYGGVMADMDSITALAKRHGLWVIEDAAQGFGVSNGKGQQAGTMGDFGIVSFHGTKVVSAGEGGLLLVNRQDEALWKEANRFHQKGTDRFEFLAGKVDRYSWQGLGISACPSEFQMAVLAAQLNDADRIIGRQAAIWRRYARALAPFGQGRFLLSDKPSQNGHIFWMLFSRVEMADAFRMHMSKNGIDAFTHFVPLHSTAFGASYCGKEQPGLDQEASYQKRLIRLPIYSTLTEEEVAYIIESASRFFKEQGI